MLAALRPDVIVTQALCDVCAVRETDVRSIASRLTPEPVVVTLSGTSIEGIFADIARVAGAIDAADEAEELIPGLRARVRSVHERLSAARAPRPRVVVLEWTSPVFTAGHWVPEMVRRAGGAEALSEPGTHSRMVSVDEVAQSRPDMLVFAQCGYDLDRATREATAMLARDDWRWAAGVEVWAIDANALASRPGPRVVEGIEVLARVMHPGIFGRAAADRASRIA
jgi:iron complex transport system substrate-binding protein